MRSSKNIAILLLSTLMLQIAIPVLGDTAVVRAADSEASDDVTPPSMTEQPETTPTVDPYTPIAISFAKSVVAKPVVKNSIAGKVTIKWSRLKKATKYEVYRSKKKSKGYKKLKAIKKTTYKDKKSSQRKTYYYKVRGVTSVDGKTVYSRFSKPVKVYTEPKYPKTVIVGECFVVALEKVKNKLPKTFRYVAEGGMTTYSILNKNSFRYNGKAVTALEKAAMYKPDRIIFIVGANASKSINPTKSANKFIKMKRMMNKINPHVQFVIMSVSPWKASSAIGRRLASHKKRHQINKAYKKVADKHKNMYYCNLTLKLEDKHGNLRGKYNGGDGLHWSIYCRSFMASELKKWLKKKLGAA